MKFRPSGNILRHLALQTIIVVIRSFPPFRRNTHTHTSLLELHKFTPETRDFSGQKPVKHVTILLRLSRRFLSDAKIYRKSIEVHLGGHDAPTASPYRRRSTKDAIAKTRLMATVRAKQYDKMVARHFTRQSRCLFARRIHFYMRRKKKQYGAIRDTYHLRPSRARTM